MAYWVGENSPDIAVFEADSREDARKVVPENDKRRPPRYDLIYGPFNTFGEAQTALEEHRDWLGPQKT
jgi:hypothetical protein